METAYSPTIKMQFGNTEITVSFSEENENDVRSNIISLLTIPADGWFLQSFNIHNLVSNKSRKIYI